MTKGAFGYIANATENYWKDIGKQDAAKRDEEARQRQLAVSEAQLKIQQEAADNDRHDKLSNGLGEIFKTIRTNSRDLDPEAVPVYGEMESEWLAAEMDRNTTGSNGKILEWQKKYPGGQVKYTKNGVEVVGSFVDAYKQIQTNKPRNDTKDLIEKSLGVTVATNAMKAFDLPNISEEDTRSITTTLKDMASGAIDPLTAGFRISSRTTSATPQNLLDNLVVSDDPKDLLLLKGQVQGMRARYKSTDKTDPAEATRNASANATLDIIEGMYNPDKAEPENKEAAAARASSMTTYSASRTATLRAPIVALDQALLGVKRSETELTVLEGTYQSLIESTNAMYKFNVGEAGYKSNKLIFAAKLMAIENVSDKLGVMANIAKQGGQGRAALEALRGDKAAMETAGITEADIDSALTRAGRVEKVEDRADILGSVDFVQKAIKAGIPGADAIAADFRAGRLSKEQADDYIARANLYDQAEKGGLDLNNILTDNKTRAAGVEGVTVEEETREQVDARRAQTRATGLAAGNEEVRQQVVSEDIEELTRMGANVQRITLRNGYEGQAYSIREIKAKVGAGLPEAQANAAYADFMQKEGASQNAIIVQNGQEPYLMRLTTLQMQNLVKNGRNQNLKLDSDGRYIIELSDLNNQLGIATSTAGIAQQNNVLSAAIALKDLVGPAAVNQINAEMATAKATSAEKLNALNAARTLAQYVPKLAATEAISTILGFRASAAEKTNLMTELAAAAAKGLPIQKVMTALATLKGQQGAAQVQSAEAAATLPRVAGTVDAQQDALQAQGNLTVATARNGIKQAGLIFPLLDKQVQAEFAADLATNNLNAAKAKLQTGLLNFTGFMDTAENVTALSGILTYDEATDIPSMNTWMKENGITASHWKAMSKYANKPDPTKSGKTPERIAYEDSTKAWETQRIGLNQNFNQLNSQVKEALADPVFKGLTTKLRELDMPKTAIDALSQSGWSLSAIDANPTAMLPKYKAVIDQIREYRRTKVDPISAKRDAAQAAFQKHLANPIAPFSQGGGDSAPIAAPAGTRVAPPAVKTTITQTAGRVGVSARNLYAFLGAESEFGKDTQNYQGLDYVGIGQIGKDAQTDVNAKYGLKLNRADPEDNMEIAARYMKMQLDKYGNDPRKAYVAYNWGAGNLDKHLARTGGKLVVDDLPAETQTGLKNLDASFKGYDLKPPAGKPVETTQLSPDLSSTKGPVFGPTLADLQGTPLPSKGKPVTANVLLDYMNAGKAPSTIGFSKSALYNERQPNGTITSYCTRFAREYAEVTLGIPDRSLPKYFGGTATITKDNFSKQGALYFSDQTPKVAAQYAGSLKAGDMVFLSYAKNPGIDHVAISDGKGGLIQHSLPSFRGEKIEGAVNRMTNEQFFGGAGNATVSFGRVPGVAAGTPVKAAATTPTPPNPTPAKPASVSSAPAPTFKQVGKIKIEPADRVQMFKTVQFIGQNIGSPDLGTAKKQLVTLVNQMKEDGYDERDIKNYLTQLKTTLKISF